MKKTTIYFLFFLFFLANFQAQQLEYIHYSNEQIIDSILANETKGNYLRAIEWIDKINENDSIYPSILTTKASYLLELEKYDEVIEICNQQITNNNEYAYYFYLNKGVAYQSKAEKAAKNKAEKNNLLQKAIETFTQGIKQFPLQHRFYYNRAMAYIAKENYQSGVDDLKKCIDINPFYANAHLQLGLMAYRAHNLAETILCLNAFLYNNPNSETSLNVLSWLNTNVAAANKEEKINVKIAEDDNAFDEINVLLENYVALQKQYKIKNKIKLNLVKQNHLLFQQLAENFESKEGFFSKKYVPFFKAIYQEGQFDSYTYYILQSLKEDSKYKKIVLANSSKINEFIQWSIPKYYEYFAKRQIAKANKKYKVYTFVDNGVVSALGDLDFNTKKPKGYWQYYYKSGNLLSEGKYNENGERIGRWVWYHMNGKIKEIAQYEDGKLNGVDSIFYENGNINKIIGFKNGLKEGDFFEYSLYGGLIEHSVFKAGKANGNTVINYEIGEGFKHYKATQIDNKIEGELHEYFDSGENLSIVKYVNNIRQGEALTYYRNGQIYSKANYLDGKLDGDYISYYQNGKPYKQGKYKKGTAVGEWKTFYKNGTVKSIENYDEKGKLNGHKIEYDYDGKIYYEYDYLKGDLTAYKYYDKKGNVIKESKKSKGKFWFEGYYPNGIKKVEGYYEFQGGKTGEWKYYDKFGNLEEISNYTEGKANGEVKLFYPNGQLSKSIQYKDDLIDGYYTEYYINGKIKTQAYYEKGNLEGDIIKYTIKGQISEIGYYHNNNLHGKYYEYAPDGKIANISIYKNDKHLAYIYFDIDQTPVDTLWFDDKSTQKTYYYNKSKQQIFKQGSFLNGFAHGEHTWYYYSGKTDTKGNFFNDNRNGTWTWYYEDGKIKSTGNYYYGDKHGQWKYFYENGNTESVSEFDMNVQTGIETGYNENGTINYEIEYYEGMKHGTQKLYSEKGELQLVRYYQYGNFIGYSYPDKNGKLIPMIPVEKSTYIVTAYYPNGKVAREYAVKNGQFNGKYIKYASNGIIVEEETYEYGNLVGEAKEFYSTGKPKRVANYIYGFLDGVEKKYYPNGLIKSEITYVAGEKHGKAIYFNENGQKIKEQIYFHDELKHETHF
jgi:antitoxin component YwqK of YwqJK toxin-antitoxin module